MANPFDHRHKKHLDSPERIAKMPPRETLLSLHLSPGDWMADIGAGTGFFSLPAADIVGTSGRVYAFDISADILADLQGRAAAAGIANIITKPSSTYKVTMESETVNFALLANVVHEVDEMPRLLAEVSRILKSGGRLAVIEWKKKASPQGPPESQRISEQELQALLSSQGFVSPEILSLNEDQYALCAQKRGDR